MRYVLVALCGLVGGALAGATVTSSSESHEHLHGGPVPSAVDVGFLQDMIVHHHQAVTMSEIVRGGVGPEIVSLADVVRGNQLLEIGQMTGFLQAWDKPLVSSTGPMHWMPGHHRSGAMPGSATQEELNRLGERTGATKEVSFLQLMIRHHQGGVLMAGFAAEHATTPQVVSFAQRTVIEQTKESRQLTAFLEQRNA